METQNSSKDFLPISTPEEAGVSPKALSRFLDRLEEDQLCMHSLILVRRGKVFYEGYYAPMEPGRFHRMYSCSKTFVSMAIGLMAGEGRLSLEDSAASYFPEYCPPDLHPFIAETTIRDLLMMATPFNYNNYTVKDPNWVFTFFNTPPVYAPGMQFCYNTCATVILTAIVEKLSGQTFLDYMRPRVLDKIGFSKDAWCVERPEGGSWGGSGVMCTTRDFARFGLLLMQKGEWNGEQLLPRGYVEEACSRLIDTRVTCSHPETQFGYGYQVWQTRHGFAMLGMGGQLCLCCPDKELMLCCTADVQSVTEGTELIKRAFWDLIYDPCGEPLPDEPAAREALYTRKLALLPVRGEATSDTAKRVSGRVYELTDNTMGIKWVQFDFTEGTWQYENATGKHVLRFQAGDVLHTVFPETHYFGRRIGVPKGEPYDASIASAWADDRTFVLYAYLTDDYFGTMKAQFTFDGDNFSISMNKVAEWFLDEYQGIAAGRGSPRGHFVNRQPSAGFGS